MDGDMNDIYKDPMFNPIMQYEQAYSYYKYLCIRTIKQIIGKFQNGFRPKDLQEYLKSLDEIDRHRFIEDEKLFDEYFDKHPEIIKANKDLEEYTEWYLEKHKSEYQELNERTRKIS